MNGFIHSLQSLGAVDGPGVRTVVFASRCPLRCGYCHNPDTWCDGKEYSAVELYNKIIRFKTYWNKGGVTFSGGEPLMQGEFFAELAALLKADGVHVALDTSGNFLDSFTPALIQNIDLALLDVKFTTEIEYEKYTGGSLKMTLDFLKILADANKRVWIRQVIVEGVNDGNENIYKLKELLLPYTGIIDKIELLPFRKLCLEKYENLGIKFPFKHFEETSTATISRLNALLCNE